MRLTLLEMVQRILSSLDSDAVNTIGETIESTQVAEIVRDTYFALIALRDWPFLNELTAFDAVGDSTQATEMTIPADINKIHWVRYNKQLVTYMPPAEFKAMIDSRTWGENDVDDYGYITTRDPKYWTSYDETTAIFDAYDSSADSWLMQAKSSVYANMTPSWSHADDFYPTLPNKMFATLLADAKSTAFIELKQTPNQKQEAIARKGKIRFQNEATRNEAAETRTHTKVNYGRK
jgi:hypothetical protein